MKRRVLFLAACCASWAFGLTNGSTGRPASPVDLSPQAIWVAPDGQRAYVVNATANSVSVVDVRARRVVGMIPVGERPYHAAFSPDGRSLYVSCAWAG
jgi:YVTN family beta-propeller protein